MLKASSRHITPRNPQQHEADRLLGQAVRAYLDENLEEADSLIGQVLALYPELADSPAGFWERLAGRTAAVMFREPAPPLAAAMMEQVHVLERSQPVPQASRCLP